MSLQGNLKLNSRIQSPDKPSVWRKHDHGDLCETRSDVKTGSDSVDELNDERPVLTGVVASEEEVGVIVADASGSVDNKDQIQDIGARCDSLQTSRLISAINN